MRAAIPISISVGLLALCVFAGLGGCSGEAVPMGIYKGEHHLDIKPGADPVVSAQLKRVILDLKEDGKATLEDGGMPFDGQVSRNGKTLHFEVLAVSGINIQKQPDSVPRQFELTVQKNGNIVFQDATLIRQP